MSDEIFPVDENDTDVMVTIDLEDGTTLDCEILCIFETDERDYIALLPVDENGKQREEIGIVLYRYLEMKDGSPVLDNIASDEETDRAIDALNAILHEDDD